VCHELDGILASAEAVEESAAEKNKADKKTIRQTNTPETALRT
jgi:hypothetical protein